MIISGAPAVDRTALWWTQNATGEGYRTAKQNWIGAVTQRSGEIQGEAAVPASLNAKGTNGEL